MTERTAFVAMMLKTQAEETAKHEEQKAALLSVSAGSAARSSRDLRADRKRVGLKKSQTLNKP